VPPKRRLTFNGLHGVSSQTEYGFLTEESSGFKKFVNLPRWSSGNPLVTGP
jgi:hypothetical protein